MGESWDRYRNLTWVALAACSSAMLIAVTNNLCQNIAPMPLLWIAPLSIYLISFVLCFDHDGLFQPAVFRVLTPPALIGLVWFGAGAGIAAGLAIAICLMCLFVVCMFCHGQLARLKPVFADMTAFYLCLSVGGALGAVFVGLVAPALFADLFELNLAITATLLLSLRFLFGYRSRAFLLTCAVAAIVSLRAFGTLDEGSTVLKRRNFYGILAIKEHLNGRGNKVRTLVHGRVVHGGQLLQSEHMQDPTFYYGKDSGVGLSLLRNSISAQRIGVIGLGIGTVASYGR